MDLAKFFSKNKLYMVSDSSLTKKTVLKDIESALNGGIKIIQYREKALSSKKMLKEALKVKKLAEKHNAILIINDRIDVAIACNAGGVHLGQNDFPLELARILLGKNKIIGVTVHNLNEAISAEKNNADYLGVSPIFSTKTKKDAGKPAGLKLIKQIEKKVKIPLVAIGGITEENMLSVLKAGADSVAMVSAIVCSDNVEKTCKKLIKKISLA